MPIDSIKPSSSSDSYAHVLSAIRTEAMVDGGKKACLKQETVEVVGGSCWRCCLKWIVFCATVSIRAAVDVFSVDDFLPFMGLVSLCLWFASGLDGLR